MVALTGFMGSGKSSVGRELALLLHWLFVDLDAEIERSQQRKIRDIFSEDGEARFRHVETEMLQSVLERAARPFVLALGGGTFVQAANAELLRSYGVRTVFLQAPIETLTRRCSPEDANGTPGTRPLAANLDDFVQLYNARLPLYRTADVTVESDERSPAEVARDVGVKLGLLRADS